MAYSSRSAKEELKEAMAVQSAAKDKPSHGSKSSIHKLSKNPKVAFAFALLLIDALLVALIIAYVPCKLKSSILSLSLSLSHTHTRARASAQESFS